MMALQQEKLPVLTQSDPIFDLMPIKHMNTNVIRFEQKDNYIGLQQLRGLGGEPSRVNNVGAKAYMYEPGVYGEFMTIGEKEILERRPLGQWDGFVDLTDLVLDKQDQLLNRRVDRLRWIGWTLVTTGTFTVGHYDAFANVATLGTFGMQSFVAGIPWTTPATATPIANLRTVKLLSRGRSVNFGAGSELFMNQVTYNSVVNNTNAADFGGKKSSVTASSLTSISDVNKVLLEADLPTIVIYDNGYIDDNGVFQLFIPNGTAVLVGKRLNGDPLGNYIMTRNVNNPNTEAGPYQIVQQATGALIPKTVEIHDGHNGGPALYYPSAIVRMTGL
jgi:hypothetical protein